MVGLTRDLLTAAGKPSFGEAPLPRLDDAAHLQWEFMPESVDVLTPELLARHDATHVNTQKVTAKSLGDATSHVANRDVLTHPEVKRWFRSA